MEVMILFVIGLVLCGPVALGLAISARQKTRQLELEMERLRRLVRESAMGSASAPASAPAMAPATTTEPVVAEPEIIPDTPPAPVPAIAPPSPRAPRPEPKPRRELDLESILGGQWLTWTGILALFFGTAFFLGVDLGTSALSGLPQVLIGLAVAAAFNVVGRWLSGRRERILGLGLLGGGVALLYLAAYAAYGFHHLIPIWAAFPLLLVVAFVGALLALDRDSMAIAALTLTGALLTPLILAGQTVPVHALLPYLLAVNLGAVVVGLRRGWAGLPLAAFGVTVLMVIGWWDSHFGPGTRLFALACVTALWLLYAVAPWLRTSSHRFWSAARAIVLAADGLLYAWFWHQWLAPQWVDLRGAALFALAILYAGGAMWIRSRQGEDEATRLTFFTGVALAVVALPIQLDASWVTLGWTALAVLLLHAGLREPDRTHRISGLAVLALSLLRSVFFEVTDPTHVAHGFRPVLNGEFLSGLVVIAALAFVAWLYHRFGGRLDERERTLRSVLGIAAVATLAWKATFELLAIFALQERLTGRDQTWVAIQVVLLFWAIYGLAAYLSGQRLRHFALRVAGLVLVGASTLITVLVSVGANLHLYSSRQPVLNVPFVEGLAVTGVLVALFLTWRRPDEALFEQERRLAVPTLLAALLLLWGKISLEVLAYFLVAGPDHYVDATLRLRSALTLSLVWALYSGALVVAGFARRFRPVRLLGMALLGLTVLKVFLFDIQALDRGYRIAAFVALGVLLLAVSVLYQRQRRGAAEIGGKGEEE